MGKKEKIQKELDRLERYAKFYLNMLLTILGGIVWSIYALMEHKTNNDIIILTSIGIIIAILIVFKIKTIDTQQDQLLNRLEKEQ